MKDPVLAILNRTIKIFSTPTAWIKGTLAKTGRRGRDIDPENKKAKCFCLIGGLQRAEHELKYSDKVYRRARKYVMEVLPASFLNNPVGFNDAPSRKHKEVMSVLRAAAKLRRASLKAAV